MKSNSAKTFISIAVILFGFATIFGLSNFLERNRPPLPFGFEDSDLALQGANLKGYSLGFEGLIADWYWMQSLQYVGDKILKNSDKNINLDDIRELNLRRLYPYLDNASTLDTKFTVVYEYGANVLPTINKEQAIALIQKGINNNPENWRFYHYLGYIYWKTENFEKASETYEKGAVKPNAPKWMQMMVARMKSEGGSRETARLIYSQMYEEAADQQTKETASLRLMELDSLDEREAIQLVLKDFKAKNNRCANNWREIFPLLVIQKTVNKNPLRFNSKTFTPVDPTDTPYLLETDGKCDVAVDHQKSKIPVQ